MASGYVRSGKLDEAKEFFERMPERDFVSWSSVISGYVQAGCFLEALDLFHEMLQSGAKPNQFTLVSALSACANLVALLDQGRWIHVFIGKNEIKMNEWLLASLIDMYAKCGEVEFASNVFSSARGLRGKVWPWNAMIGGFAMHGNHGNMVNEGRRYFRMMESAYGIKPEIEHYGCMVDLLGRAGLLDEAEDIISSLQITPDAAVWGALLG
ncbi:hypothetical protein CDL15_Pgr025415 [Punica granatum]|uniref:Pentatricopeptide repeat-containing protein n=1 Tax=Punica granatum TaxID=22663 RepID=A0A218W9U1_PUNGR|nr:hypothetical protein CDL15_Pgr025415 [Punica granatum]